MIRINLLPPQPHKAILITLLARPPLGLLFGVLGVLILGGIGGYWYMLSREAAQLTAEKSRLEIEFKALEAAIAKGRAFKQKALDLEKRLAAIDLIAKNQARPIYLLDSLADTIPRDLWLTTLEEKQNQLRLAGSAYSATAVADFMSNLRGSGKFKDVDLVVSRQDFTKDLRLVTFEVTCAFSL